VVPGPSEEPEPAQLRLVFGAKAEPGVEVETKRSSRHPWAWLLRRVFAVLAEVGLGPRPPPRRRPAVPGQLELKFAA
jgi:hypothetical protein